MIEHEEFWIRLADFSRLFCNRCGLFKSLQVKITGKAKTKIFLFIQKEAKTRDREIEMGRKSYRGIQKGKTRLYRFSDCIVIINRAFVISR